MAATTRGAASPFIAAGGATEASGEPGVGLEMAQQQMSKLFDLLLENHLFRHWETLDTLQRD